MSPRGVHWKYDRTTQVCRVELPTKVGHVSASSISKTPLDPPVPCQGVYCPNITVYDAGEDTKITEWTHQESLDSTGASYLDFQTISMALTPFSKTVSFMADSKISRGSIACIGCPFGFTETTTASRILGTYVSTSGHHFEAAFQYALLHAIALTYRTQLPFFNGLTNVTYSNWTPATFITNPVLVYACVGYTWLLLLIFIFLRWYTLSKVGVDRSESVLCASSLILRPSPLSKIVDEGSLKSPEQLAEEVKRLDSSNQEFFLGVHEGRYGLEGKYGVGPRLKRRKARKRKEEEYSAVENEQG